MTWTLTPSLVSKSENLVKWKVVCTSDGNALTATDVFALMNDRLKRLIGGSFGMRMTVEPGTGGVIPNTTINVTITNAQGHTMYAATAFSKDVVTPGANLSEDWGDYIPIYDYFGLAINDIGDSGDQVTLYFDCWLTRG